MQECLIQNKTYDHQLHINLRKEIKTMAESKKSKAGKKLWYIIFGIIAIVAIILGIGRLRNKQSIADNVFQTVTLKRGDLVAKVGATGKVEANQSARLFWQINGQVADINVNLNDDVYKGETLASLEETSLPQSVILARADLVSAQRALENLLNSNTAQKQAYYQLLNAEEILDDAKKVRDRWNYNDADQESIDDARDEFIQAEEVLKQAEDDYSAASDLTEDNNELKLVSAQQVLDDSQDARDDALEKLSDLLGKTYDRQAAKDYAVYDIAEASLEDAQGEWDRVKNGPNAEDVRAAEARVAATQATIALASLEAPFDGTVTESYQKVGDEVSAGTLGFRIDDLSKLIIEVEVPEVDINLVQVDQTVEITFDGIQGKTYHGKIIQVAPVGNSTQGEVKFILKAELTDADTQVKPGMTSAVNIIVSKLENVIIVPNRAVRLKDGKRVVYILLDEKPMAVEVKLGASSDSDTEILSGNLHEGDLIVLNPPLEFEPNGGMSPFAR